MPHAQQLTKPSVKPKSDKPKKQAVATRTKAKPTAKNSNKASKALATCPVNGAGWCPYPFSVEQLERRLKEKAAIQAAAKKSKSV